ncbi:unnamed protein product, partial [Iphiclides podalirius]
MKFLVIVVLLAVGHAKHEKYQGWRSYFVNPSDMLQLSFLGSVARDYEVDFLSRAAVGREGLALVRPQHQEQFAEALKSRNIAYRIHAEDVKAQLDIDDNLIQKRREVLEESDGGSIFDNYQELEKIDAYLEEIAEKYSELVTLVNSTSSFEEQPIKYLKISKTKFEERKPVMVIDGGIHGREWIAPSTVLYAIHKLIVDVNETDLLENYDWILLPVVNPDGYKYTFTNDRFWSKTRSTDQHLLSVVCPGVDANSNFDFFWNTVGISDSPCTENYPGSSAASEKETQVVTEIIDEYAGRIVLYVTLHSYGSYVLYPWGHDGSFSNQAFALQTMGVALANAIYEKSLPEFRRYIVGNSVLVTGQLTSGSSVDYAHLSGVPISFNLELPGLGEGSEGFHLDPRYIKQVGEETWSGIAVAARRAADLFGDQD